MIIVGRNTYKKTDLKYVFHKNGWILILFFVKVLAIRKPPIKE